MKIITIVSPKNKISGKLEKDGAAFLVFNGSEYEFVDRPKPNQHLIAAFCNQKNEVVVIRVHNSISFGKGDDQIAWIKDFADVHVGIEPFKIVVKKKGLFG